MARRLLDRGARDPLSHVIARMSSPTQSRSHPINSETRCAIAVDPAGDSAVGWATPPERPRGRATLIGETLGAYRVLELVGSGGMGCVYRAEHALLGRTVALKVLHEHHARRRDAALRLFQEARASSQIRHRNIVDVVDYLELDGDLVCIVMEYLPGPSLAELMGTPGALPAARALDLLAQIADGLEAAHGAGIVHRDLKPDNVVVVGAPDGGGDLVKLLDFGVAKPLAGGDGDGGDGVDAPLTAAGQVVGTPPYMAPEQASGVGVDARTDVYALGAIMYEIFTGETPFVAHTFDEYVFKHLTVAPAPPRTTPGGGDVDPRIESVIMRCLEKDPAARFGSARELASELVAIRDALELTPTPPPPPDEVAPVPAFAWHGASAARPRVKRSVWAGLAVAAAVLVGFALARGAAEQRGAPAAMAARTRGPAEPPAGPALVRIVSEPPARVYPAGRDQAMCSTPCAIAIAPRVGRAARPTYTVRRRGYRDEAISVDPDAPPSQVRVRLEREHRAPDKATRARIGRDRTLNPFRDVGAPSDRP